MDVIKNNILISKFMGYIYTQTEDCGILYGHNCFINYHNSWDLLMPVVEKIEEMDVVASFVIEQPTIYIWKSSEESTFQDIEVDIYTKSKIEAVYEAVIKFIEWYNENKE